MSTTSSYNAIFCSFVKQSSLLRRLSTGAQLADLYLLGYGKKEGATEGAITISKDITDKNLILIEQSVTGLYSKQIKLGIE